MGASNGLKATSFAEYAAALSSNDLMPAAVMKVDVCDFQPPLIPLSMSMLTANSGKTLSGLLNAGARCCSCVQHE